MIDVNKYPAIKKAIEVAPDFVIDYLRDFIDALEKKELIEPGDLDAELDSLTFAESRWAIEQMKGAADACG